ncbi:MAG: YncE family protein [Thermoleophilia bacterium]
MEERRDDCGATNAGPPGMRAAGAAALLVALCLVVFTGCMGYTITKETEPGVTTTSVADGSAAGLGEGDGSESAGSSGGSDVTAATSGSDFDRVEVERRLALPPFAYVAEADVKPGASGSVSSAVFTAAFAVVDSLVDTLAARPECASHPIDVAVAPDGELVYVTDWGKPVIHVLSAETKMHLRDIELPGLRAPDVAKMQDYVLDPNAPVPWDWVDGCSGAIAVTPDGALLLVATHSGLMVVDVGTEEVLKRIPLETH